MTKNTLLIFTAVLLIGGAFAFAEYNNNKEKNIYTSNEIVASANNINSSQNLDSDGDGVKDWEEILVGTDPKNPKSKTPDTIKAAVVKDLTKTTEKLSPIDTVSRDFFARYVDLRQQGISQDKLSQQELISKTVGNITLSEPKPYTADEILTKSDTSKDSIKKYGNEVGDVFLKYKVNSRDESVIARDAQVKNDPDILKEIDPIIQSYKNMINALIKIKAPSSISTMHLDFINGMNSALFVAQSFRGSAVDPIKGLQAIGQYQLTQKRLGDAARAIRSYLSYLGITYSPTEGGYIFTK